METIRGKASLNLDLNTLNERLAGYDRTMLDLGTGDGKFAFHQADSFPNHFVIGVDSCRENLHEHSRAKLPNLLFVIASAQNLPAELNGLISQVTINFPWGSLLASLLNGDLMHGLGSILGSRAQLEVRLNGGALAEAGWSFEEGAEQIRMNLIHAGWRMSQSVTMDSRALRSFPSTWAKRLAFGRDPRVVVMNGCVNNKGGYALAVE